MVDEPCRSNPFRADVAACLFVFLLAPASRAEAEPVKIVALGDSLTAGAGLPASQSFPAKLEAALKARGHDVVIVNAGVSGNTVSDGLARLDWSVTDDAKGVIVELGAKDMLRGVDPATTRAALDRILQRLEQRHLPVLLTGMFAQRNLGAAMRELDAIFPDLARKHGDTLYPFFFDGLTSRSDVWQADGLQPKAAGVDLIVERIIAGRRNVPGAGGKALVSGAAGLPL